MTRSAEITFSANENRFTSEAVEYRIEAWGDTPIGQLFASIGSQREPMCREAFCRTPHQAAPQEGRPRPPLRPGDRRAGLAARQRDPPRLSGRHTPRIQADARQAAQRPSGLAEGQPKGRLC